MEALTWTNSLQAECANWPRNFESSKATVRHIKQISREPQANPNQLTVPPEDQISPTQIQEEKVSHKTQAR